MSHSGGNNKLSKALITAIILIIVFKIVFGNSTMYGVLRVILLSISLILAVFIGLIFFAVHLCKKEEANSSKKSSSKTSSSAQTSSPKTEQQKQKPAEGSVIDVDVMSDSGEPEPVLSAKEKAIIDKSIKDLGELRLKCNRIKDQAIKSELDSVCGKIGRIIKTLKQQPEEIDGARQCLNYYIPTLNNVFKKYLSLEASETMGDEMKENVRSFLGHVSEAMDKQYTALFDDDQMDLNIDMEAMKIALKRDGLI